VKLLAGLLEPTSGSNRFDGVDLSTRLPRPPPTLGVVVQESYLFEGTIAENIALGDERLDSDRVIWAARAASAHEFVDRLPLGYDVSLTAAVSEVKLGWYSWFMSGLERTKSAVARSQAIAML
jgi:ATP-binding cassette subfamily B protein